MPLCPDSGEKPLIIGVIPSDVVDPEVVEAVVVDELFVPGPEPIAEGVDGIGVAGGTATTPVAGMRAMVAEAGNGVIGGGRGGGAAEAVEGALDFLP